MIYNPSSIIIREQIHYISKHFIEHLNKCNFFSGKTKYKKSIKAHDVKKYVCDMFFPSNISECSFDAITKKMIAEEKLQSLQIDAENIQYIKSLFISSLLKDDEQKNRIVENAMQSINGLECTIDKDFDFLDSLIILSTIHAYANNFTIFKETDTFNEIIATKVFAGSINTSINTETDDYPFEICHGDDYRFSIYFTNNCELQTDPDVVGLPKNGFLVIESDNGSKKFDVCDANRIKKYNQLKDSEIYSVEINLDAISAHEFPVCLYKFEDSKKVKVENDVLLSLFVQYLKLPSLAFQIFNVNG